MTAVCGPEQAGASTLVRQAVQRLGGTTAFFDLRDPLTRERWADPALLLREMAGTVVFEAIERLPGLVMTLRDLPRDAALPRLVLLANSKGSYWGGAELPTVEVPGLGLAEVGETAVARLWLRGGLPLSFLAGADVDSATWRRAYIRDVGARHDGLVGRRVDPDALLRLWTMLARRHGAIWNSSEFARSLGIAHTTVERQHDLLRDLYLVRDLPAFVAGVGQRERRAPRCYVADSGLLHSLLGVAAPRDLTLHPQVGASWAGFMQWLIVDLWADRDATAYYWATHAGAKLDLLLVVAGERHGFEFQYSSQPRFGRALRAAQRTLALDSLQIVYAGDQVSQLERGVHAVGWTRLLSDI